MERPSRFSLSLPIHLQSQNQSKSTQLLRRICICKSLIVLPPLERIPPGKELWQSFHPTAWVGAYLILEAKEKEASFSLFHFKKKIEFSVHMGLKTNLPVFKEHRQPRKVVTRSCRCPEPLCPDRVTQIPSTVKPQRLPERSQKAATPSPSSLSHPIRGKPLHWLVFWAPSNLMVLAKKECVLFRKLILPPTFQQK